MIVVLTAPDSAIGGAPWAVAAFCVAPILWAAGSLLTANVGRPVDRVVASAVQLLAGGSVLLLVALALGQLDPARWSGVSWTSAAAAVFLLVFDSLVGFMLYTRLLEPGGLSARRGRTRAARADEAGTVRWAHPAADGRDPVPVPMNIWGSR